MAVINGSIVGVQFLHGYRKPGRKAYLLAVNFAAYTGAADTCTINGVGAAIAASTKNGKTNTLRGAIPAGPGLDTNAQEVYATGTAVQAMTVSSDDLTGQLSGSNGTELTSATASEGVQVIAIVDES